MQTQQTNPYSTFHHPFSKRNNRLLSALPSWTVCKFQRGLRDGFKATCSVAKQITACVGIVGPSQQRPESAR
jgi:hypothetical protein